MTSTYLEPSPCNLGVKQISDIAAWFSKEYRFEPGADWREPIEAIGGKINYESFWDLKDTDSGSIQVEPDGSFVISLPDHTSALRDRFTIGHELGHFVLHYALRKSKNEIDGNTGLKAKRFGKGQTENEANWFSAALLMPGDEFTAAYTQENKDIERVADRFRVSTAAAAVRVKVLGLGE
jgi:Zn-dependent peptidase ImmA (M78 family)